LTDLSVEVQSAARGAVCGVFAGSLGAGCEVLGTCLRKTEFDVARPSTIKSPARSVVYTSKQQNKTEFKELEIERL